MFVTYALTLMCSILPCTHVLESHELVPIDVTSGVPLIPFVNYHPINEQLVLVSENYPATVDLLDHNSNLKNSVVEIRSSTYNEHLDSNTPTNHLLIPSQDQPHATDELGNSNTIIDDSSPIVRISDGGLRGFNMKTLTGKTFSAFQAIPFAQPPIENLRFKSPVKNFPWKGTRDAIAESPTCIQADYIQMYKIHGQEDCLYLNVYTPQLPNNNKNRKASLPVMVFIHGGGWFFSTSSLYGPGYLLDQEVVLVTLNYRLSMFGFLSTGDESSPGNNGLKDQVLAMKWVQENIAKFGGDSGRVTIFGESAGAGSVHFHMLSPLSRGLFHRGISQSGCATCFWSISERSVEITRKYASILNCTGTSHELVECLRGKDAAQLAGTQLLLIEWLMYPVVIFGPVIEPSHPGAFLDELPESIYRRNAVAKVPWISGFNNNEGAINIATLFLNNQTIKQLNDEWDKYGPIFLELKDSAANSTKVAHTVRNYYMGDKSSLQYCNRESAVKMFGDRYVVACGVKGIQFHAQYSDQPVYAYRLSFKGKYSVVQLLGQNAQDWGVSHLDDLIYLFNNTAYYPTLKVDDEEFKMAKIITGIWANFAATGKPLMTTADNELKDIWYPVSNQGGFDSKVEYLDLNLNPRMIRDPFHERVKFWRSLGLADNV